MGLVNIKTEIELLSKPRLGSIGEYIFAYFMHERCGVQLKSKHKGRTDFLCHGTPIDVKTTAKHIRSSDLPSTPYKGEREEGIKYAQAEFLGNSVRISIEERVLGSIEYPQIEQILKKWKAKSKPPIEEGSAKRKKEKIRKLTKLKKEIKDFFLSKNKQARIIYRITQSQFGNESPHNLKPKATFPNRITVYLDFRDHNISLDNIRAIYAFPDFLAETLPILDKTRLHKTKVDLKRMPSKFVFRDIEDLKANFERMSK
jgi:hypothetical protein